MYDTTITNRKPDPIIVDYGAINSPLRLVHKCASIISVEWMASFSELLCLLQPKNERYQSANPMDNG